MRLHRHIRLPETDINRPMDQNWDTENWRRQMRALDTVHMYDYIFLERAHFWHEPISPKRWPWRSPRAPN
jgi:hypothetical protein